MALLVDNWQRKVTAFLLALIIWQYVNHSFTETKTLPQVPIKIINLPPEKTIGGMLPNGILSKRISLTLTGTKEVIDKLESGDIEIQYDASGIHLDEWAFQVHKSNLVSLNPSINLANHITQVHHQDYILRLSPIVTDVVPITVLKPKGKPPPGYEFLDVLPQKMMQTVSGPERDVREMKSHGLEIALNLDDVTAEELDHLQRNSNKFNDEVSYLVPQKWKTVKLPYYRNPQIREINDPCCQHLRIDFLRQGFLPLDKEIYIRVFHPKNYKNILNPGTTPLVTNDKVQIKDNLAYLSTPLFVKDVGKIFLELIKDNIEIAIIAVPTEEGDYFEWSLQVINPHKLEDIYIAYWLSNKKEENDSSIQHEEIYRERFRNYLQKLKLYNSDKTPLNLYPFLTDEGIVVQTEV